MTYLAISAFLVCLFGYRTAWRLFDFNYIVRTDGIGLSQSNVCNSAQWSEYYHTPKFCTLLLFVLSALMGFALSIMAIWQFWLIARGETSVESSDNESVQSVPSLGQADCSQVLPHVGEKPRKEVHQSL